jgi:hypothetical protein
MSSTIPIVEEVPTASLPIVNVADQTVAPKKRVIIALPGREFSSEFMLSLIRTLYVMWESNQYEVILSPGYSSHVALARLKTLGCDNLRGGDQKAFNGMPYDTIVFIDSDIVWNPEQFLALVQSAEVHPVVAGIYRMSDLKHTTIVKHWDTDYFCKNGTFEFLTPEGIKEWKDETKQRYMVTSYSGMGFMAIKKEVMDALKYPFFDAPVQEIVAPDGKILRDICSEDVGFCKNIQKAGYEVYVDTEIVVGHQKSLII